MADLRIRLQTRLDLFLKEKLKSSGLSHKSTYFIVERGFGDFRSGRPERRRNRKRNQQDETRMDELDRHIIKELKQDGRKSAKAIAEVVSVSAVTVRARIRALEKSGQLQVVAVTDFAAAGYGILVMAGVEVEQRHPNEVGMELAAFDQVLAVNLTAGAHDIEMLIGATDLSSLANFLENEVGTVPGIGRLSPAIALEVHKYQSETEAIQ